MGELGRAGDVHDAAVSEGVQVVDDLGHRAGVVGPEGGDGRARRDGRVVGRRADDHGGQAELRQQGRAGVADARVDDEEAVHAVLGPPAAVDRALCGHVLHQLEEQAQPAGGEGFLDAGDELEEERLDAEAAGGARQDQADGGGALAGQCPGGGAGLPAELFGHAADPGAGGGRDARPVVEREGDRALGHTGAPCDVLHRRSAAHNRLPVGVT